MKTRLALAAWLIAAFPAALPAWAGQPVALRADAADADGIVTLGDIFADAGPAGRIAVAQRTGANVLLNAAAVQAAARRAGLDWANAEGVRSIVVRAGVETGSQARGNVDVLTYARAINAGEIVQPQDLVWAKAAAAPAGAISDPQQISGLAARHALRAGAPAAQRDVAAAQVIKQGEIITVTYEDGGISLSLQGKALANAGVGEALNVQNLASKKTIQATVTGPGQAVVGPAAERLRLSSPPRYAAR